jgi:hypothetical protein
MRLRLGYFLLGVAATVCVLSTAWWLISAIHTKRDFTLIVERLRSGEVTAGTDDSQIATLAVNASSHAWTEHPDGDYFAVTYSYRDEILILFLRESTIFAALHVKTNFPQSMEWLALDTAVMGRYLDAVELE